MIRKRTTIYRYSLSFKQKVVSEIERGELGIEEARRHYGIGGGRTIQEWIKKLGKNYLLSKVVRIEMIGEKDRMKELETENQRLKAALADEHLRNIALESIIEVAEDKFNISIKKKNVMKE